MDKILNFDTQASYDAIKDSLEYPTVSYVTENDLIYFLSKPELYEWVDLGLPSGLKWATCNVGATKPEEYGLYFAWGETQGYTGITDDKEFSWSDYKWCNGSNTTLTKYNKNSSYGTVDNLSSLTESDDAASATQSTCKMPTKADFEELTANTTSTWERLNGVYGRRFTSKTNGNSIFVPAAGLCSNGSLHNAGSGGYYWSSSLYESNSRGAWRLDFDSDNVYLDYSTSTAAITVEVCVLSLPRIVFHESLIARY